ncbi:MAG: hypothetical protein ACRYHA_06100 [Janthinobacterium lividum]
MSSDTLRPQNRCVACGYTWFPRGKSLSMRCPRCTREDIEEVRATPASAVRPKWGAVTLGAVLLIAVVGWWGHRADAPQAPASASVLAAADSGAAPAAAASDASAVIVTQPLVVGGMAPVGPGGSASAPTAPNAPSDDTAGAAATAPVQAPAQDVATASDDDGPATASPHRIFPTSFDCSQATHDDERAVCKDPGLAAMDREMGQLYAAALQASAQPQALAQSQRDWLTSRNMCDGDLDCLRQTYGERLGQFHDSLNSPPLTPDGETTGNP